MSPLSHRSLDVIPSDQSVPSTPNSGAHYLVVPVHQNVPRGASRLLSPSQTSTNLNLHLNWRNVPGYNYVESSSLLHNDPSQAQIGLESHQSPTIASFSHLPDQQLALTTSRSWIYGNDYADQHDELNLLEPWDSIFAIIFLVLFLAGGICLALCRHETIYSSPYPSYSSTSAQASSSSSPTVSSTASTSDGTHSDGRDSATIPGGKGINEASPYLCLSAAHKCLWDERTPPLPKGRERLNLELESESNHQRIEKGERRDYDTVATASSVEELSDELV
ncbi:uncharacterized protein Z519_03396 [Cladophialophora bantiana CBS 173.52]|uniref:Unplaced genomic scaffold supercont1.4, whole genome shotgun sequence n=1 Tax=Cladophialophora bantiana (strain ATCC 10958 / CBS 173.52 / CDC B-1940 / NIH 8579) TaxID=1442370 RepID=A0A0D2GD27_CLAB1|nr:uncharacterized protein Z519_03396 [Cladophialophora bantiana CBS 173.52]KIW96327.1 hypothetical protein Z519_03396 [Cladophialophora bantiana CBS 173.52]